MAVPEAIRQEMATSLGGEPGAIKVWHGRGCLECEQTGYRGRVAVLEIFLLDEVIREMISHRSTSQEIRQAAHMRGMRSLRDAGWEKAAAGLTSIEEISRITSNFQVSYQGE